ncbi:unnamed protein product [Protopolystoma xenopodis]|uniref:Uncharacterized protein n=1 Tax=Protopolystoma xenopodis TaxID=117903 RepID=A0A3S5BDA8_9PLAT|nr:unnamed protein product [Protopolystoma xenopodis]
MYLSIHSFIRPSFSGTISHSQDGHGQKKFDLDSQDEATTTDSEDYDDDTETFREDKGKSKEYDGDTKLPETMAKPIGQQRAGGLDSNAQVGPPGGAVKFDLLPRVPKEEMAEADWWSRWYATLEDHEEQLKDARNTILFK